MAYLVDTDILVDQLATFEIIRLTEIVERRAYAILKAYAKSHGIRTVDSLIAATAIEAGSRA